MIVIDVGNTNIVLGVYSNTKLKKIFRFNSKSILTIKEIKKKFTKNYILKLDLDFNICIISSVVIGLDIKIKDIFEKINLKIKNISYKNLPIKIKFDIDNPHELGNDRIANSIAAINKYGKNCLVIDFGTATTFDIVKKPGIYEGGVIAPGINLSILNLNKSTAALPIFKLKSNSKAYGKNTNDALNAGFLWGYQGLINNIIKKISLNFKTKFKIILTGGYATVFINFINNKSTIDKHITIKGIMFIYRNLLK